MRGGVEDDLFTDAGSWPPGFRFHPTDEELILYYLKRKICKQRLKLDVIREVDVYKWDPEELPGQSILKSRDRQWYFFTTRDRKYPNAARSNRATRHGYWKATGKDRLITWNSRLVGVKKTLVFYKGRAPCGERTDWVMHEYTMEENELQRCKNVQDYYALCKLFKKSGPGPKNGEQYGAPFREEDWVDEDEVTENSTQDKVTQVHQNGYGLTENTSKYNGKPLVDDIDALFRQIAEEAELYTPPNKGNTFRPSQIDVKEETQSTIMGPSHEEPTSFEPLTWYPHQNQQGAHESFIATQSTLSDIPSCEAPEVTSASKFSEWDSPNDEGVDYLEINDLEGPQKLGFYNINGVSGNSQFEQEDIWHESDIFFDAEMLPQGNDTFNQNLLLEPYIADLGGGFSNQESGQRPTLGFDGNQSTDELWIQDQNFDIFAPAEPNQTGRPPTTGALTNHTEEVHNWEQDENGDIDSWFRSSISALLDSVPARPALASESELINRAFQRMSSFSRLTASAIDLGAGARGLPIRGRGFSRNVGILFFSVLGVVSAVLFMWGVGAYPKSLTFF